jgi:hypothetical protein
MKMGNDEWKLVTAINVALKEINSSSYGTSTLTPVIIGTTI